MSPTISRYPNPRRMTDLGSVLGGGLIGSAARMGVGELVGSGGSGFPWATLGVNLVGAALAGFYLARRQRSVWPRWSLGFWAIGALGSFTTFSGFSVEVVRLTDDGRGWVAVAYVLVSMLGGVLAALIGDSVGRGRS
ncbi:MAG: CrcB family protein [Acidimicrobiia bacterium]